MADGGVWKLSRREQNVSVVTVIMGWLIDQSVGGGVTDHSLTTTPRIHAGVLP